MLSIFLKGGEKCVVLSLIREAEPVDVTENEKFIIEI